MENELNVPKAIEEDLHVGDYKQATLRAHTIKGNAGSMGAVELGKLAQILETSIELREVNIWDSLSSFSAELNRLVEELRKNLPLDPPTAEESPSCKTNLAVVTPILNRLKDYIISWDCKAEHYLDDYHSELADLPEKNIEQLKECLNKFEFAGAHDQLLALTAKSGIILTSNDTKD